MTSAKILSEEIYSFLADHAGRSVEDPAEYSSPDASLLDVAAYELEKTGKISVFPYASWESGGFKPYTDDVARAWLVRIKEELRNFYHRPN